MQKKGTAGIVRAIRNGTAQAIFYALNFIAAATAADMLTVIVMVLIVLGVLR